MKNIQDNAGIDETSSATLPASTPSPHILSQHNSFYFFERNLWWLMKCQADKMTQHKNYHHLMIKLLVQG
jgi:hypothetical protein